MQPTMTTAEWLRRAADAWSEADTTQDQEARRVRVVLAEGFERLAKHAAFLAEGDGYPSVDNVRPSIGLRVRRLGVPLARKLRARRRHGDQWELRLRRLPECLVRGLVALLATPFLLLTAMGIALRVLASRKRLGGILKSARRRTRWWLVIDIATALLGVATLDWLVDAF